MTNLEFSNQFDVLFNNIANTQAPGLDEYEKSILLTKAQTEIVKAYFSPALNKTLNGFDDSPVRQADFSSIIKEATLVNAGKGSFDKRAIAFRLPDDLFISLNEQLCDGLKYYTVVPLSYTEYSRLMSKPFKFPPKNQVWRLITNFDNTKIFPYKTEGSWKIVNKTNNKTVKFVVTVDSEEAPSTGALWSKYYPKVQISDNLVTITCLIPKIFSGSTYWSMLILDSASIKNRDPFNTGAEIPNLEPYVGNFNAGFNEGSWESFEAEQAGKTLLDIEVTLLDNAVNPSSKVEIIGSRLLSPEYHIRYIKSLSPIILIDLADLDSSLSILGETLLHECELPEELHEDILLRAVELAKAAMTGDLTSLIVLGQSSGTEKGIALQSR